MPLLRRQTFTKEKPPPGLKPDDEVFHCTITNEIFVDYEKFFERIILCNSMVWTCSITGRSGLTYQEALDCEAKARKQLASFPDYLQKPILYLATLTHRSRLNDLNDDVFQFTKDRFFINEVVEAAHEGEKKTCRVIKVISPKMDVVTNGDVGGDSDSDVICLDDDIADKPSSGSAASAPEVDKYQYVVQEIKKPNIYIVGPQQLNRKKGLYTREKSKLYLKQHCDAEGNGIWKVKARYMKKFALADMRWESLFDGLPPKFVKSEAKKVPKAAEKKSKSKNVIDLTEDDAISNAKQQRKLKKQLSKEKKSLDKKKAKEMAKKEAMKKLQEEKARLKEGVALSRAITIGELLKPVISLDALPPLPSYSAQEAGTSAQDPTAQDSCSNEPSPLQLGQYVQRLSSDEISDLLSKLEDKNGQISTLERGSIEALGLPADKNQKKERANPEEVQKKKMEKERLRREKEQKKLKEKEEKERMKVEKIEERQRKIAELEQMKETMKQQREAERKRKREEKIAKAKADAAVAKAVKLAKMLAPVIELENDEVLSQCESEEDLLMESQDNLDNYLDVNNNKPHSSTKTRDEEAVDDDYVDLSGVPEEAFDHLSPTTRSLAERIKNLSPEELRKMKEELKEKKRIEKEKIKEQMKKQREEERQQRNMEKMKERVKKLEEKKQQEEHMKAWSKPRDDLQCDDLKDLPKPREIQSCIPSDLFGPVLMVIEYMECFKTLFDLEDDFPNGITLEPLCKALKSSETDTLYVDLVRFLLTAIFNLQEEEEEEEALEDVDTKGGKIEEAKTGASFKQLVEQATVAAQVPAQTFGSSLSKLHMDSFTLTEILRLHFMGAGARSSDSNSRFRYQQRGGYTSLDDAGLEFRRNEVELLQAMQEKSVFDLLPGDKLKVMDALIQQILTYVASRDVIEDNYERLVQVRKELRGHQAEEKQRERDEAAFWYRQRLEEKKKSLEAEAAKKEQKKKDREDRIRLDELRKQGPLSTEDQKLWEEILARKEEEKSEQAKTSPEKTNPDDPDIPPEEERKSLRQREKKQAEKEREWEGKEWRADIEWDKITPDERAYYNQKHAKKEAELHDMVSQLQSGNAVYPLGRDRTFRRYWMFRSVPGLFVEDDEQYVPDEYYVPAEQVGEKSNPLFAQRKGTDSKDGEEKSTSSDKENDSFDHGKGMVNGVESKTSILSDLKENGVVEMEVGKTEITMESVHEQIANRTKMCWAYYETPEQLDKLIDSLNPRGYREGPLKQALIEQKARIIESMQNTPVDVLQMAAEDENNSEDLVKVKAAVKSRNRQRQGQMKGGSAEEFLELNLREMLLDIEERIFNGGLGQLKVNSRISWRDAIEDGGYEQGSDVLFWSGKEDGVGVSPVKHKSEDSMDTDDGESKSPVVRDLAKALLQIRQMLEPKYMQPPLGEDEEIRMKKQKEALEMAFQGFTPRKIRAKVWENKDGKEKKDKEEGDESDDDDDKESDAGPKKSVCERWEESVMQASGLSQIFLHLSVLENSIVWTKSAMHARCKICRRKGDEEKMLLCDGCDKGYHMYCLKPKVRHVPQGDWFCAECKPKDTKTPRKRRQSTFVDTTEDEEADSDAEGDSDDEDDSDDDSSDDDSDDSDDSDDDSDSDEEQEEEEDSQPAKIKFTKGPRKRLKMETDDEEEDEKPSRPSSRNSSRRGSRANTPKRDSTGKGRHSLEKAVMEKAMIAKGKKSDTGKGKTSAPTAKKSRHSIETATPSVKKTQARSSRRSLPDAGPAATKRKRETSHDELGSKKPALSSKRSGGDDALNQCENLLTELMDKDEAWPFLLPVSRKDAPDYFTIVKEPMDLGTIRTKVKKYEYDSPTPLLQHIRLTFANCEQYNMPQTAEYKAGQKMSRFFEKKVKDLGLDSYLKVNKGKSPAKPSPKAKRSSRR